MRRNQRRAEVIVRLADGWSLQSGSDTHRSGDYVRLCSPDGREHAYWHYEEWQEQPVLVMGAIINAAAGLNRTS